METGDGGHNRDIAAHGYAYPAGQLAHASVFSWFPGYLKFRSYTAASFQAASTARI
jgi:hypothetical protein